MQGLRTIQKYSKDVLDSNFAKSVNNREGQVSSAHVPVGTGAKPLISFEEPFDAVEVDAYKINAFFSADFLTPRGTLVQVQLARIWLIAMIEVISEAIIAYSIVYRSEVSAEDVLGVIRQAVLGQNRKEITIPGLTYPTDGCFPGDAINAYKGATWGSILLDGALVHLSDAVHNRARNEIGFAINWGPAGHFERRPNIERFFSNVSKSIFMRLPSTTGSNPGNGRAKNAEDQAVKYKINADEVEQLFAVHVANYNHTPSYGNFYNSPIGTLKHFAENTSGHFIARKLPIRPEGTTLIPLKLICTVRGGRQHGRRSYVQYLGVRYTNQILSNSAGLIGKRLTLEFDSEDLRFCKAFLEDGSELGILQAGGRWHITKHNLKTRKIILSLVSKRIIVLSDFDDPVHVYLQYLTKSKKSSNNKPKGRSKKRILEPSAATEAVRVAKSADVDIQITENSTRRFAEPTLSPPKVTETFGNSILGPLPDLNKLLNGKR